MTTYSTDLTAEVIYDAPQQLSGADWSEEQILLYQRIIEFNIDSGPVDFSFTARLARENGWTFSYSKRVVHEYKRFIFLIVNANHPVAPSDQVDQAWHLHLTYSRSYWDHLCHDIIGRQLHHTPTRGGSEEAVKFAVWYDNTLETYERVFGTPAPTDLWPNGAIRFGDNFFFQRINTRRYWIIRKPPVIVQFAGIMLGTAGIFLGLASLVDVENEIGKLFAIAHVGISIFIGYVCLNPRCTRCHRFSAMKKTGTIETRNGDERWEESRCKYCDFHCWRKSGGGTGDCGESSDCGDGGGCGGCGGCG